MRPRTKGGKFSDMKLSENFARSLRLWLEFAEAFQGVRLRAGSLDFAASPYVFPGSYGKPFTNEAFNARLKSDCKECTVSIITPMACGFDNSGSWKRSRTTKGGINISRLGRSGSGLGRRARLSTFEGGAPQLRAKPGEISVFYAAPHLEGGSLYRRSGFDLIHRFMKNLPVKSGR